MKSWIAGMFCVAALAANVANADMIFPTGGILTAMDEQTIIDSPGWYARYGERQALVYVSPDQQDMRRVAWGHAEVVPTSVDSWALSFAAGGYSDIFQSQYTGTTSGRFTFDVTASTRQWIQWDYTGDLTAGSISVFDAQGGLVVQCVGLFGCGQQVTPGSPTELWVSLAPGEYEVRFSGHSEFGAGGAPVGTSALFTMTPVPLPAAAWLLLSGLGGLGLLRRRRVL